MTNNALNQALGAFMAQFDVLSAEEADEIARLLRVRFVEKGTVLVREGEVARECYFVLKGCLRQYFIIEGVEKTTEFYTENQSAVLFTSYKNQTKSSSFLVCVEDSILILGDMQEEDAMYQKFPKLQEITRLMMEQDLGKTQDALAYFIASSPEERYLNLIKTRPALLQRVPQHQIASYIGVTPESLSRIRKRLLDNG